jgi:hypothetical protein
MKSLNMSRVKSRLSKGRELIGDVAWCAALGMEGEVIAPIARAAIMGLDLISISHAAKEGGVPEYAGACVSGRLVRRGVVSRLTKFMAGHIRPQTANDVKEPRTRFSKDIGMTRMVIVYHEATNRHVDIHIGRLSIVKNLPKDFKISTDPKGYLTQVSKERLIELVASEFRGRARLAQNLDHSAKDARMQWHGEKNGPTGYGSGPIREVISDEPVYVWNGDNATHVSAPHIVNNKQLYVYQLYPGTSKRAPIMSLGVKEPEEISLNDRLHLKFDHDMDTFIRAIGPDGDYRVKYDGSSCYVVATPNGTRVYSPRLSAEDGKRIEYTSKLPGVEKISPKHKTIAMGELLFVDKHGRYIKSADQGGLLNRKAMPPNDLKWEIRMYRVDSIDGKKVLDMPQDKNIGLVSKLCSEDPGHLKVPEVVPFTEIGKTKSIEGVVGVAKGKPITEGRKLKWRQEHQDGVIKSVEFGRGPNGGITGVVVYIDDKNGQEYRTSSGMSHGLKEAMMEDPEAMKGVVMKLSGFKGHPGRAAVFTGFHQEKGKEPPANVQAQAEAIPRDG